MLSSAYDILELFHAAFQRKASVGGLIQIDCSGRTRYAEGTKDGVSWRIEVDMLNRTPMDKEQLRMAYAHLGEHLLIPFYSCAKQKLKGLGWSSSDIEKHAMTAMKPVLEAMRFNMGMATEKGWLDTIATMEANGNTQIKEAEFTFKQAVDWTQLGKPGRWSSMELMSMLIAVRSRAQSLDVRTRDAWLDSHGLEHRPMAKRVMDNAFSPGQTGDHGAMVDAWKSWWMQMQTVNIGATALNKLRNWDSSQGDAMVEGWYLRVAQSKEMGRRSVMGMEHLFHAFPTPQAWKAFADALTRVFHAYPTLVWKDKESQAWLLHRAVRVEEALAKHPAMQNNRVHEYLTISRNLDPTRKPHELYPLWRQMQIRPTEPAVDVTGLFDEIRAGEPR